MPLDEKGRLCLDAGETAVLHITEWKLERMRIAPRNRKGFVFLNVIRLKIDSINGEPAKGEYLISSEKLAKAIKPLLDSGAYKNRSVVLSASGEGQQREVVFSSFPRGSS